MPQLTLPPAADVVDTLKRDWNSPKKLQAAFGEWVKHQPPFVEVIAATLGGSTQVRDGIGGGGENVWTRGQAMWPNKVPPPPPRHAGPPGSPALCVAHTRLGKRAP